MQSYFIDEVYDLNLLVWLFYAMSRIFIGSLPSAVGLADDMSTAILFIVLIPRLIPKKLAQTNSNQKQWNVCVNVIRIQHVIHQEIKESKMWQLPKQGNHPQISTSNCRDCQCSPKQTYTFVNPLK